MSPRPHPEPPDNGAVKQVRAASRALDIIETVAAARAIKHTDIAEKLGIPKSTTTLILETLVRSGYLQEIAPWMSRAITARFPPQGRQSARKVAERL